jgi:hypothetical protein
MYTRNSLVCPGAELRKSAAEKRGGVQSVGTSSPRPRDYFGATQP